MLLMQCDTLLGELIQQTGVTWDPAKILTRRHFRRRKTVWGRKWLSNMILLSLGTQLQSQDTAWNNSQNAKRSCARKQEHLEEEHRETSFKEGPLKQMASGTTLAGGPWRDSKGCCKPWEQLSSRPFWPRPKEQKERWGNGNPGAREGKRTH